MEFYIFVTVVSVAAFTADMILRYMEKIRSFGMEQRFHNIKGKLIPIEDFIPHNITMLCVFFMAFGSLGIFMRLLGINAFFTLPCCIAAGCLVNFIVMHFLNPLVLSISGEALSAKDDISETEAVCIQKIPADDYGRIELEYKNRKYTFDAISENETDIDVGEKVLVLYREDGMCVVEKTSEVLDIINEK